MKRFLLFWALSLPAQAPAHPFDENALYDYMRAQDIFIRTMWGCPERGYPPAIECVAGAGKFDARQWERVYAKGHALFGDK